ncbi:MAG: hypothetical protein ACQKBV_02110 [Puniceicoccales bacterium]
MGLAQPRNPGPSWGFRTIHWWDRHLPRSVRNAVVWLGGAVARAIMPAQRAASHEYLQALLGRPATRGESIRQFEAFTHSLLAKLRMGEVDTHVDWLDDSQREIGKILYGDEPILLGTFHVGASDLLGFHIKQTGRRVCMIRQRVENSEDIDRLIARSGGMVECLWVNSEAEMIFTLRDTLEAGKSLAMQCDRVQHASKSEAFEFLGARRLFPVTIYRLASLYERPVLFCVALPQGEDSFGVVAHEPFFPTGNKRADQQAAHAHFQSVLHWLESLLRAHPYEWFNFLPLNPASVDANPNQCPKVPTANTPPSDAT